MPPGRARRLIPLLSLLLTLGKGAPAPAVQPVLLQEAGRADGTLLGVWDGRGWRKVPGTQTLVQAGIGYRSWPLSGPGRAVTGGAPVSFDAPCPDAYAVPLRPALAAAHGEPLTRADVNARPRPVTVLPTTNQVYVGAVRTELQRRGLKAPVVQLRSVSRADLDGDGRDEIIVEATHFAEAGQDPTPAPPVDARPGDYSVLLLRWTKGGQARTTVLEADVVTSAGTQDAPRNGLRFQLEGVADANGDGRMELYTSASYYEGYTLDLKTWTPAQGAATVLSTGCGA